MAWKALYRPVHTRPDFILPKRSYALDRHQKMDASTGAEY